MGNFSSGQYLSSAANPYPLLISCSNGPPYAGKIKVIDLAVFVNVNVN
jgi:hypothetical protein